MDDGSRICSSADEAQLSDGELCNYESASTSEDTQYDSAHSDTDENAVVTIADAVTASASVIDAPGDQAPPESPRRAILGRLGLPFRPVEAARLPRDSAFRQWQADKAAAQALASGCADIVSEGALVPALPVPTEPSPKQHPASPPSVITGSYHLASPPTAPLHPAPPGPELDAQVAELMSRDPEAGVALALAIFRHLPTAALAAECERVFPSAPPMVDGCGVDAEKMPQVSTPQRQRHGRDDRLAVATSRSSATVSITKLERCFCCDDEDGDGRSPCEALRLLNSMGAELEARDKIVEQELADGFDEEATLRGARWFMYRTWVARKYGYLGAGVRVRIPDCAIVAIRSRYRAPGCTCAMDALVPGCNRYRGHSDK